MISQITRRDGKEREKAFISGGGESTTPNPHVQYVFGFCFPDKIQWGTRSSKTNEGKERKKVTPDWGICSEGSINRCRIQIFL